MQQNYPPGSVAHLQVRRGVNGLRETSFAIWT